MNQSHIANKTTVLVLEDDPRRVSTLMAKLGDQCNVHCVDTAQGAIDFLQREAIDVLMLDHDLGGHYPTYDGLCCDLSDPNTGSEVVRWMIQEAVYVPCIIIHSMNPVAAASMAIALREVNYPSVYRIPFSQLMNMPLEFKS